jgi:transcription termination/antitermination protein NusG
MEVLAETKQISNWYILRTQANKERVIADKLKKQSEIGDLVGIISNVIVPIEQTFYVKNGKKIKRDKVLFPGYIFVQSNAVGELKQFIKMLSGCSGFLTSRSGEIQGMTQNEVNKMIGIQEDIIEKHREKPYVVGEKILISDGPFSGMKAIIDELKDNKVKLSMNIFGRVTHLEMTTEQIQKDEA